MNISKAGLDLIKRYEGLRLTAYKPVPTEKYWTIGYGHYGSDVTQGMTITEAQADAFLKQDCASAVKAVNALHLPLNQNQFDALVSFTYNCGAGNLKKLCNGRTIEEIGEKIILYNKAGGKVLNGLVRRRKEEQTLYKSGCASAEPSYYEVPVFTLVESLDKIDVDSSYQNRKLIAAVNGIKNYSGTAEQNTKILELLMSGKLQK